MGVNIHEKEESAEQDIHGIDPRLVNDQINNLKDIKKKRDNTKVQDTLDRLQNVAKSKENIMPSIINCVKKKCTLGEISDTLRLVFGEH